MTLAVNSYTSSHSLKQRVSPGLPFPDTGMHPFKKEESSSKTCYKNKNGFYSKIIDHKLLALKRTV